MSDSRILLLILAIFLIFLAVIGVGTIFLVAKRCSRKNSSELPIRENFDSIDPWIEAGRRAKCEFDELG